MGRDTRWGLAAIALLAAILLAAAPVALAAGPEGGRLDFFRVVLVPQGDGSWLGVEMASIRNHGERPLERIEWPMAATVRTVQLAPGFASDGIAPEGPALVDHRPLPPGEVRDLVFTYTVPADQTLSLEIPFAHGAASVLVLVPEGVTLVADGLQAGGAVELAGQTYRRFAGPAVVAGGKLALHLAAPAAASPAAGNPPVSAGSLPGPDPKARELGHVHGGTPLKAALNLAFIVTVLVATVVGTSGAGRRLSQRLQRAVMRLSPERRRQLILQAAALDLEYQAGHIAAPAYRTLRSRLLNALQPGGPAGEEGGA